MFGGWQMTGLGRVTSGLPFGAQVGAGWVTSWDYQSFLVKNRPCPHAQTHNSWAVGPNASPTRSHSRHASSYIADCPVRYPIPGEAGTRNAFRGDGVFGVDSGLNKSLAPMGRDQSQVRLGGLQYYEHPAIRREPEHFLAVCLGQRRLRGLLQAATPAAHSAVLTAG